MFFDYAGVAMAIAQIHEATEDARRWKEAGNDPIKRKVLHDFEAQRSQRRHEMAVARASAPVTNVTVRNYW